MLNTDTIPLEASLTAINAATDDEKVRATARGLMRGYHARWADEQPHTVEAMEREFRVSIYNLDNNSKRTSTSRTFTLAGKWDAVTCEGGQRVIVDHKTTSSDIADPDAVFWRQLAVEAQPSTYLLAAHYAGLEVSGALWDVIRKPKLTMVLLDKKVRKAITSLGEYFGYRISPETQQYALKGERENGELFEYRLARKVINESEKHFQRRPVLRLHNELVEAAQELWQLSQEVISARRTNRHIRNGGACLNYGTACEFLGICSGLDNHTSNKWQRRESVHEELHTINGDGRDVLTHSRLACFQTCRKKHYFRYELGIERVDRVRSDALYFGTIMHKGLEAWWKCFTITQQQEEDDGNC